MAQEKTSFRQRGYECPVCAEVLMTFGNAVDPVCCTSTQVPVKKWDHWVIESVVIAEYQGQDTPAVKG